IGGERLGVPLFAIERGARLPNAVLFAAMALRLLSGFPPLVELPYWYLSYSEGFIRRAFIGTFMMPWLVGRPAGEAASFVVVVCGLAALGVLASFLFLFRMFRL